MSDKKPRLRLLKALINGDMLLLLRADRLLPYIRYFFILGWFSIWISYKSEQTMTQVEKNKKELESLKIYHAQKTCEFVGLDRISTIEQLLIDNNSQVKAPQKPANIIK
jgi:hypothetical protein